VAAFNPPLEGINPEFPECSGKIHLTVTESNSQPALLHSAAAVPLLVCPVRGQLLLPSRLDLDKFALHGRNPRYAVKRDFILHRCAHQIR
jgi:hypothetical protein